MLELKDPGTKLIVKNSTPGSFFRVVGGTMTEAVLYFQLGQGTGSVLSSKHTSGKEQAGGF